MHFQLKIASVASELFYEALMSQLTWIYVVLDFLAFLDLQLLVVIHDDLMSQGTLMVLGAGFSNVCFSMFPNWTTERHHD